MYVQGDKTRILWLHYKWLWWFLAGEQKWARKTNLDWKGVTPFAQVRDLYNGESKSILRATRTIFQLECKESVECYCSETHVGKHGVTFDWLLHTHGWKTSDTWKWNSKGQELGKLSKRKARNRREREMQDAWTAGIGGEKGEKEINEKRRRKKRGAGWKKMQFSLYSCS